MDLELAKKEINEALETTLHEYAVDADEIIVGGFSSGGRTSLDLVLDNALPIKGFVVLCPPQPNKLSEQAVAEAAKRQVRGALMTTEMDPRLEMQKEMVEIFEQQGLAHRFVITPNVGHWYPENLSDMIDEALVHIRQQ